MPASCVGRSRGLGSPRRVPRSRSTRPGSRWKGPAAAGLAELMAQSDARRDRGGDDADPDRASDWRVLNRANWDERVAVHLAARDYDLAPLRAGRGRLNPIEEAKLGPVGGLRVLHLQCHFGGTVAKTASGTSGSGSAAD